MQSWFEEQYNSNRIKDWNVILSGIKNGKELSLKNTTICLTNRAKIDDGIEKIINLKTISRSSDHFIDIDCSNIIKNKLEYEHFSKYHNFQEFRRKYGLSKTPLLIIYIINKDSVPQK